MAKMLLIIMNEDEERIRMPLSFAKNQIQLGNEIRAVFWGPSERAMAGNDQLRRECSSIVKLKACINSAKKYGLESKLFYDLELIPVGEYISRSITEGFEAITF
ncbi:MAG: hypothetical protein ACP5NC_07400 [Nitrososphaeria archaeon]